MYDIPCSTGEYPPASSRTPLHGQLKTEINFLLCEQIGSIVETRAMFLSNLQSVRTRIRAILTQMQRSSDISNLNIQAGFQCCGAGSGAAPFFVWSRSRFDGEAPARFLAPTVECRYSDNN